MKKIFAMILVVILALSCTCFAETYTAKCRCRVVLKMTEDLYEQPSLNKGLQATSGKVAINMRPMLYLSYGENQWVNFLYDVCGDPDEVYTIKIYINGELHPEFTSTREGFTYETGAFRTDPCLEDKTYEVKIVVDFEEE